MSRARLVVSLPDGTWLGDLSAAFPDATVRLPTALADDTRGIGLCRVGTADTEAVLDWFDGREDVEHVATLHRTATDVTVQFETDDPLLLSLVLDSGVPIEFPIEVSDGRAVLDVVGEPTRITDLGLCLDDQNVSFTVEHVREYGGTNEQLTGKQHSLVTTAVELGYYDTPRECSLTDLADSVGLAKSTVSETLHRAESTLIKSALGSVPARHASRVDGLDTDRI